MVGSPVELDTDGAILLRQEGGPNRRLAADLHGRVQAGIVQQLEKTLAEVSRELDIQPSVIREWKRGVEAGATTAVAANEDVVPASALREAQQLIRELERLLGRKQMEVEILQAAQEVVKKSPWLRGRRRTTRRPRGPGPLSAGRGRHGAAADPRRNEQPGDLRISPRLGDGQPAVPGGLQPQAHPPGDAVHGPMLAPRVHRPRRGPGRASSPVCARIKRPGHFP
jgi:Transposase